MFYLQNLWRTRWMFYLQNLWGVWSKVLIVVMCSSLQLNRFAHSMVRTRLRFCAFDIVNTSSLCNPNPLTHSSVFNRFLSFVLNADWERLYNNRVSVCVRRYNSMQLEHLCILSTALLFLWPLFFLCFSRCNVMQSNAWQCKEKKTNQRQAEASHSQKNTSKPNQTNATLTLNPNPNPNQRKAHVVFCQSHLLHGPVGPFS